jgi:hypothetical protein
MRHPAPFLSFSLAALSLAGIIVGLALHVSLRCDPPVDVSHFALGEPVPGRCPPRVWCINPH